MLLLLLLLFEPRPLDQCSFFACALLYPGPISTFHSRSVVHSLCRLSSAFGELVHVLYVVPSLALLCVYVSVCVLPLQFVNRRAATSDNPLFTIHNLNPVSHLSSICITILVCPFNKHLLAQKCTSVREWRISPIQIFFRYDPLELLSLCVKPVSPPLCTFFFFFSSIGISD